LQDITGIFEFTIDDYYRIKSGIQAFILYNAINPFDSFSVELKKTDNFGRDEYHVNIYKTNGKNNTTKKLAIFLIDKESNCIKTTNVR